MKTDPSTAKHPVADLINICRAILRDNLMHPRDPEVKQLRKAANAAHLWLLKKGGSQ